MSVKGIRISDIKDRKCIPLSELLLEIPTPNELNWALLWLDVVPIEKEGKEILELQKKTNNFEFVFVCSFEFLTEISTKIFQEIELLIIGCKDRKDLVRYEEDQEMYEHCDMVIEMIDGGCWEIFSKNIISIELLAKKFKETEFLKTDFNS